MFLYDHCTRHHQKWTTLNDDSLQLQFHFSTICLVRFENGFYIACIFQTTKDNNLCFEKLQTLNRLRQQELYVLAVQVHFLKVSRMNYVLKFYHPSMPVLQAHVHKLEV